MAKKKVAARKSRAKKTTRKTKKLARLTGRKSAARKKTARRPAAAKGRKTAGRAKAAAKAKVTKKQTKKRAARPAAGKAAAVPVKKIAKPKLPRRTTQAAPPPPVMPAAGATPPAATPLITPPAAPAPALPPAGPKVGDPAPDFDLPDEKGQRHTLAQYRGRKVVLYFYPKDDTPGCTTEACGFRNALASFTDRNAVVLGVSPDSVGSHQRFAEKFGLTFPLLADESHAVAEKYGVWVEKNMYGRSYWGVARTTYIIDADGRVAHIIRNVRPEGHEQEVLNLLGTP